MSKTLAIKDHDGLCWNCLETKDNILGAMITVWSEDSEGISNDVILKQTKAMYNAMYSKLK